MVRLIRDFNSIDRRERMAVNLTSLFVGIAIVLVMDWFTGLPFGRSISNIGIILIVGVVISLTYNAVMKRHYLKDRQTDMPCRDG